MEMSSITFQLIVFRVLALLIIAGVHGGIVAATAVLLGDKGPGYDGRVTINPTAHVDVVGAFSLTLFGFGWTRPTAIDAGQFRIGRIGIVLVILAGVLGLLAMAAFLNALILPALTTLPQTGGLTTAAFLRSASSLMIWFALFNLVPLPPLTGGLLLRACGIRLSQQVQWILVALLLVAAATGVVRQILRPAHTLLASVLFGV